MPKTTEALVKLVVNCASCLQEITPGEETEFWKAKDVQRVGMFQTFDCPHCSTPLQLPFDLFTMHHEPETPLRAVGRRRSV